MNLFDEFFSIAERLEEHQVTYCVIGGIAMAFHDQPRFTRDIDILVAAEQIEQVRIALKETGYFESTSPWTFKGSGLTLHRFMKTEDEDYLVVDVLLGSEPRHMSILEGPVKEVWTGGRVRIANKEDLIWLKERRLSDQDRVDIGRLKDDKTGEGDQRDE